MESDIIVEIDQSSMGGRSGNELGRSKRTRQIQKMQGFDTLAK